MNRRPPDLQVAFLLLLRFVDIAISGQRGAGKDRAVTTVQSPSDSPCGTLCRSVRSTFKPAVVSIAPSELHLVASELAIIRIGSDGVFSFDRPTVPFGQRTPMERCTRSRFTEAMFCDQSHTHLLFPGCVASSNDCCVHASTRLRAIRQSAPSSTLS